MNNYAGPMPLNKDEVSQIMFNCKEGVIDEETAVTFLKLEGAESAREWLSRAPEKQD